MRFHLALLTSLILHLALILAPAWFAARPSAARPARIEARLLPPKPVQTPSSAEAVNTAAEQQPDSTPTLPEKLRGAALKQAQSALSKHLFYPPEAVAAGLEGEVMLLLTLGDGGRIITAEIARSSSHRLLDEAALAAVFRIGVLPGNPRQMLLPVSFHLQ